MGEAVLCGGVLTAAEFGDDVLDCLVSVNNVARYVAGEVVSDVVAAEGKLWVSDVT